jgi:hypothetical protein
MNGRGQHLREETAPRTIKTSESTYDTGRVWEEQSLVIADSSGDGRIETSSKSLKC